MKEEQKYNGSKTRNYFTAYLLASIRGKRLRYLEKQQKILFAEENLEALKKGIVNLEKHIENLQKYGVPVVVTLNSFVTDTKAETDYVEQFCHERDCESLEEKIETIAKEIYGADGVTYAPAAKKELKRITDMGLSNFPVCMAKTQYSLSDDQTKLGRPEGFTINVREVYVSAGAGFVVAVTGAIMTMPGLPKKPAAYGIDVNDEGVITGLF